MSLTANRDSRDASASKKHKADPATQLPKEEVKMCLFYIEGGWRGKGGGLSECFLSLKNRHFGKSANFWVNISYPILSYSHGKLKLPPIDPTMPGWPQSDAQCHNRIDQ